MAGFNGESVLSSVELGLTALPTKINQVYGSTVKKLSRPSGMTVLVLLAYVGEWQLKPGDSLSSFPAAASADVTDGSLAYPLAQGKELRIAAPKEITVKAANATDKLIYYWA